MKLSKKKLKESGKKILKGAAIVGGGALLIFGGHEVLECLTTHNKKEKLLASLMEDGISFKSNYAQFSEGAFDYWTEPNEHVAVVSHVNLCDLGKVGEHYANLFELELGDECGLIIESVNTKH